VGFQHLSPEALKEVSRKGGKAVGGKRARFTSETGQKAGKKGAASSKGRWFTSETGRQAGQKKKGKTKR